MWQVYILECSDGTLYTGITNDLDLRLKKHGTKDGAKYTRRGVKRLVYAESLGTKPLALKREREIKSWPRSMKMKLAGL